MIAWPMVGYSKRLMIARQMKKTVFLLTLPGWLCLGGCVSVPPLVQVEHRDVPPPPQSSQETQKQLETIEKRLEKMDRRLEHLEGELDKKQ